MGAARRSLFAVILVLLFPLLLGARELEEAQRLAQQGRWEDARAVLLAAHRRRPQDARFAAELGGIAFKQKRYGEAARWMHRALRLNPSDAYAADFLGTVYFLQGNLEAALKYWNRIGKPRLGDVRLAPDLRVDPVLLDRAFTFAPDDTLARGGLLATRAHLRALEIFPAFALRLEAREDGRFDAAFTARERNGFGNTRVQALVSAFRGAAYQTLTPEYFNIGRAAVNIESMVRWDPQKRRLAAGLSGPLGRRPGRRYRIGVDLRDEDWEITPEIGGFQLRKGALGGEAAFYSGIWSAAAGAEVSYRDYSGGPGWRRGYQLKQTARVTRDLWRAPERRFESAASVSSELAPSFERLQVAVASRWLPTASGGDYAVRQQVRAGGIFGEAPFDELFMLGLERDNDLWLRSHVGTRGGRKGSAPLGRRYFLFNWEIDKNIYDKGIFSVKMGPFLDFGRVGSALAPEGRKWLIGTGVQAKFRILGAGFTLIWGKDLRSGRNAFYLAEWR